MFNFTGKTLVATITLTCSTAFLLFGYDQGVLSGIIGGDNQFGKHFDHPDANTQGLIVSVYHLGDVGGAIYMFFFGGYHGRKRAIIGTSVIMLIGAILQTASINRRMMYAARVITGVGNGANTATIPVWQAETSTAKGSTMVLLTSPDQHSGLFLILVLVLIATLPESPRWLHKQGRHDEANVVITRLIGSGVTTQDPRVQELAAETNAAITIESAGRPFQMKELFQGGKLQNFRRMCLCFAVDAFQQLGGICVITYYLPKVLEESVGTSRHTRPTTLRVLALE